MLTDSNLPLRMCNNNCTRSSSQCVEREQMNKRPVWSVVELIRCRLFGCRKWLKIIWVSLFLCTFSLIRTSLWNNWLFSSRIPRNFKLCPVQPPRNWSVSINQIHPSAKWNQARHPLIIHRSFSSLEQLDLSVLFSWLNYCVFIHLIVEWFVLFDVVRQSIPFNVFKKQWSPIRFGMETMSIVSLLFVVIYLNLLLDLTNKCFSRWSIKLIWSFIVLPMLISFSLLIN